MTPEQLHFFADELREMEKQALLAEVAKVTGAVGKKFVPGLVRTGHTEAMATFKALSRQYAKASKPERVVLKPRLDDAFKTMNRLRNPVKGVGPNNLPPAIRPPSNVAKRINKAVETVGRTQGNVTAAGAKLEGKIIESGVGEVIQGANTALINTGGNVAGIADAATTAAGGALKGLNKVPKAFNGTKQINQIAGEVLEGIGNLT